MPLIETTNSLSVLSDRSPPGCGLQCLVPAMDRAVSLCLSPHPSLGEDSDQDQDGPGGGGHRHHPPTGPGDPGATFSSIWRARFQSCCHMGSPVTTPTQQGHALPHRPGYPPVGSMETEQCTLQDKGFSHATIRTIFAATHDTS